MYSHGTCLAVLYDRKLRIRQVEKRHFLVLPVSDVWGSDRITASVLQQIQKKWQLRGTMADLKVKMHFKQEQTTAWIPLTKRGARPVDRHVQMGKVNT